MIKRQYKILIYGAGVVGSIYAVSFAKAGYNVSMLARSKRLEILKQKGLLYEDKQGYSAATVKIIEILNPADKFDFIFVTVRYEQIENVLLSLQSNSSPNIVTMVNNPYGYDIWEEIVGKCRLIPAFAGAGGSIEDDVLCYNFTPYLIQPTTFGEIAGRKTKRLKNLAEIFKTSRIPYMICGNMDAWQKSHLAMVTALANGIYYDGGDNYTTAKNKQALRYMSQSLKENYGALKQKGISIIPFKLNIFRIIPLYILEHILALVFNTKFAETLIYKHAQTSKIEMKQLHNDFWDMLQKQKRFVPRNPR